MFLKKREIFALGCLTAASVLCGATTDVVKESFENAAAGAEVSALGAPWGGYGVVEGALEATNPYPPYAGAAGRSIQDASVAHSKVLRVEGQVSCTLATPTASNKPVQIDMMVQATLPDEALAIPSGETDGVQIAVGVDTDAKLKVYCKNKSGVPGWYVLADSVTVDQWYRVSFIFDYANNRCQLRVDGQPVMTANGYLTATAAASDAAAGAWYNLNATENNYLSSVKVIGSTALDDMLVQSGDELAPLQVTAGAEQGGIPLTWYDAHGIAWDGSKKYDGTDLTVAQKYERGLSPFDGEKLMLKSMTMTTTGTTFAIPKLTPPAGKAVKLVISTTPAFGASSDVVVDVAAGAESVTVDNGILPAGCVFYYRLEIR